MNFQAALSNYEHAPAATAEDEGGEASRKWYAVYTMPRGERSVAKHLELFQIESFLPTYESTHIWKNRQRVKVVEPLFPSYLFVRIRAIERSIVLRASAALMIVGNRQGPSYLPDSEIEFLRLDFCQHKLEPYKELVIGKKVCVKNGAMQGMQGVLVKKRNGLRFVLSIEMINQSVAVEVAADEVSAVLD